MFRFGISRCCCDSTPPAVPNAYGSMYVNSQTGDPNYWGGEDKWLMNDGSFPSEPFPDLVAQSGIGINTRQAYCASEFLGSCSLAKPEVTSKRIGQLTIYRGDHSAFDYLIGETVSVTRSLEVNNTERYSVGWGDPISAGTGGPKEIVPVVKYIPSWGTPTGNEEYYGSKECKFKIYGTAGLQLSTATSGQPGYIPETADEMNAAAGVGISMDWDLQAALEAAGDYVPALDVSTIVQAMVDSTGFAGSNRLVLYFIADAAVLDANAVMMSCDFPKSGSSWVISP